MTDCIFIRDLMLRCIIGIYDHERRERQDVVVNLVLYGDYTRAGQTDSIDDATNYKTITKNVIRLVEDSSFFLIETLADRIASVCLKDKRVQKVTVTVDKPGALRFARSVAVQVTRDRKSAKPPADRQPTRRR